MIGSFRRWLYKHRKAVLITATVVTITSTVAILLIRGKKVEIPINKLAEGIVPELPDAVGAASETIAVEIDGVVKEFPRKAFVRQLHEGWSASQAKLEEAAALDIVLQPGETLVNACTVKRRTAA